MRGIKTGLCLSVLLLFICTAFVMKSSIRKEVKSAFKEGNAKLLSRYFDEIVVVSVDGLSGTYSNTQAENVMADFFAKNPPKEIEFVKEGTKAEDLKFTIATYTNTRECLFRLYYESKKNKQTEFIQLLNIDKINQCSSKK